jgi:hypothetical protein
MAAVKAKTPTGAQAQVAGNSAINLDALMGKALQELRTSKDRAMHAAAYSYIIWSECQTPSGKAWFDAAVKAENAQINDDNAKIKKALSATQSQCYKLIACPLRKPVGRPSSLPNWEHRCPH